MTPDVRAAFTNYRNDDAVRYVEYWDRIAARTDAELFRRYLFAFASIHTTWKSNVSIYQAIKDHETWLGSHEGLRTRLVCARGGLHNARAANISSFASKFWADPAAYRRRPRESWSCCRARIAEATKGLGPAKTAFALELAYPLEAEVLCVDVHMARLYGADQSKMSERDYAVYEADWVGRSRAVGLPPFIVKQIYWDGLQGRPDSRYWSHVFEEAA